MSKFHVGQKVGLLWENTPYYHAGMLAIFPKVGVIKKLPSYDTECYDIIYIHPDEPDKVYKFFDDEMIDISSPTLSGDTL